MRLNVIDMFFLTLAVLLSILLGRYFFGLIGWWGVVPGILLGSGLVVGFLWLGNIVVHREGGERKE